VEQVAIRAYRPEDEPDVVRIWNASLFADPINVTTWRAKVLLDPNFDPEGCHIAEIGSKPAGFLLSLVRRVPFFGDGYEPGQAWMTAFGVDPAFQRRGAGSSLLDAAFTWLKGMGVTTLSCSPYVPNYFTPGPDVSAYAIGIDLLQKRGFTEIERPISMRAELTGYQEDASITERRKALEADGVDIRPVTPLDIVPLLEFIRANFSADWHREASGVLNDLYNGDGRTVGMVIARKGDTVLGYAEHRNERYGPFGVREDQRGNGIGRVLLSTMLGEMLKKNYHAAWFLWTGDDAARLYSRCGFHPVRRFSVLKKEL